MKMESINDMLKRYMLTERALFEHYDIRCDVDLDVLMPKIYPDFREDRTYSMKFGKATVQLFMEQRDALLTNSDIWAAERGEKLDRDYRFKLRTKFDNGLQRIIFGHNGRRLSESNLSEINGKLDLIARKVITNNPSWRGGNLIAALELQSENGRIHLENLPLDSEYSVRTTVEIPLPDFES